MPEGKKGDPVKGMGGVTAFVYHIQPDGTFKRDYIFGKPRDKGNVKFCNFYASSYDPIKNIYATIMTDEGQDKKTYLVWLRL